MIGAINDMGVMLALMSVIVGAIAALAFLLSEKPRHLFWLLPTAMVLAMAGAGMAGYAPGAPLRIVCRPPLSP